MINYECDFHLPARFVGTVAHSFCQCGYGAMQHREAPAEHSEHLHLVSFPLPNTSPSEPLKAHRHGCLSGRHRPWPTPPRYQHAFHSQTRTHSREMKLWRLTVFVNLTTLTFFLRICLIICTFTSFGNDHLVLIVFFRPCFLFPSKKSPKRDLLLVPAAHIFRINSFSSP